MCTVGTIRRNTHFPWAWDTHAQVAAVFQAWQCETARLLLKLVKLPACPVTVIYKHWYTWQKRKQAISFYCVLRIGNHRRSIRIAFLGVFRTATKQKGGRQQKDQCRLLHTKYRLDNKIKCVTLSNGCHFSFLKFCIPQKVGFPGSAFCDALHICIA